MKKTRPIFLLLALLATSHAADAPPAGFKLVKTEGRITEYTLEANGLTVLLLPDHSAPAVTFMVTYRVGSRNESYGTTGATHILEHLMFKGTAAHNKTDGTGFDQILERTGAETNATTWLDRTNYFETTGPQDLPLVVELEADRMRNLRLLDEDRRPEMTVVRNEFERGENNPASALETEIWSAAYIAHPYHHNTIGWRSDIENVPIEKLRAFYDTYYWPDNATVSVIGDFEPAATLALIASRYAAIPRAPHPVPQVYTEEPRQSGPRRVTVQRPGELPLVAIAHKIPPGTHADFPGLQVLGSILTDGRNSRLYQTLTDKNLTTAVTANASFNRDPSLHILMAELTPGTATEKVEKLLIEGVEKVKKDGVTPAETASAIARITAATALARDGSFAMADALNDCIAVGDWTLYDRLSAAVRAVTPADVQRVARTWLLADQSTTGLFLPKDDAPAAEPAPGAAEKPADIAAAVPAPAEKPAAEVTPGPVRLPKAPATATQGAEAAVSLLAPRILRSRTAGLDLLVCPTGVQDVITVTGSLPAFSPANPALGSLTAGMFERGTKQHTATQLAGLLDAVGAQIQFTASRQTIDFSAKFLKKDTALVIGLLAEQLRQPAFPADEFAKLQTQLAAATESSREDTDHQAATAFSQAAFPAGHPNRRSTPDETLAALKKTTLADVKTFHHDWCGPAAFTVVAVGDLDPASFTAAVEKSFTGWTGGRPLPAVTPAPALGAATPVSVSIPGKESLSVVMGQPSGLRASDPDHLPLALATAALGSGFTSRLIGHVRDTEGLTYGIASRLAADTFTDGQWAIRATFAPALLEKGLASTRRELTAWHQTGLTADEFAYRQNALAGAHRVSLATTEGLAGAILGTLQAGQPLTRLDTLPAEIHALTLDQVNAAIKKHLDPEKMIQVIAGSLDKAPAIKK